MAKAKVIGWPGLKYAPVEALVTRHHNRLHRAGRRNMLRFFAERGLGEFYERVRVIRDDPSANGLEKMARYREIESDYIKHITASDPGFASAAAKAEADVARVPEAVGVPVADPEPARLPAASGNRNDDDVGVSELGVEIVGDA
jgi:hypothetical protein